MSSDDNLSHTSFHVDGSEGKNLVLGAAAGYSWDDIKPFVLSLRASGYTGDLVLFRGRGNPWPGAVTDDYGVKVELFDEPYPYVTSMSDSTGLLPARLPREPTVYVSRYILCYLYLRQHGHRYDRVMLADVRDMFFQRDPFDFPWHSDLCCFLEDDKVTIMESHANRRWVGAAAGEDTLQEIGDEIVSCSGLTTGTAAGVLRYLEQMVSLTIEALSDEKVPLDKLNDQGLHNVLLYKGRLGNVRLLTNETGPVLTLGYTAKGSVKRDSHGQFLIEGGDVANVLHQYDRHADILNVVLKRYYGVFYRLKKLRESVLSYSGDPRKMLGAVGIFLRVNTPGLYTAIDRIRSVCRVGRSTG